MTETIAEFDHEGARFGVQYYAGAAREGDRRAPCRVLLLGEDNPQSANAMHALYDYPEGCAGAPVRAGTIRRNVAGAPRVDRAMTLRVLLDADRCTLLSGDSVELGDVLAENTIDAIVCDPPAAIAFMGKSWDKDRGGFDGWTRWLADLMAPSFRALKPGGHALVWALPRTSHWTTRALELCGFEIRDVHHDALALDPEVDALVESLDDAQRVALARVLESASAPPIFYQIFGTGFPKSLNVGKAIDAHLGIARAVVGTRRGTGSTTFAGEVDGKGLGPTVEITTPSPEAARFEGVGTAPKPAVEHWILARKPLGMTVAECALLHGTGGLNIDACRIGTDDVLSIGAGALGYGGADGSNPGTQAAAGRWPAHLSLDEVAATVLDDQSIATGMHSAGKARDGSGAVVAESYAATSYQLPQNRNMRRLGDKGGASRFFYVAKGSRREKDEGLDHLPKRTGGEATDREDGSAGTMNPRAGAGRTGGARNVHPTVKSQALMRWLVRLITPPGGIVLDPFAGSGSTGVAALAEGARFIGCEQGGGDREKGTEGEYLPILVGRLRHALGLPFEAVEVTLANAGISRPPGAL